MSDAEQQIHIRNVCTNLSLIAERFKSNEEFLVIFGDKKKIPALSDCLRFLGHTEHQKRSEM